MKLRGALFGCGMISEFHLRGWKRIPEVEIVALGNRTVAKAELRREQFVPGARVYSNLAAMIEREELDFIDILTLPALHHEHCLLAKQAGLHIICQKPLCNSLDDARDLAGQFSGYHKIFAVHENHRYRPWFQRVRKQLQQGSFGQPSFLRLEHFNATWPGEAYKNEAREGVLFEYGSHLVDMMRNLLGEPRRVYARFHRPTASVRAESLAHVVYEYPEATAVVETGWKAGAVTQGSLLLVGDKGEAYYEGTLTRGDTGRLRLFQGSATVHDEPLSPYDAYVESFYLLQRECTDAMLGRGRVTQTAAEHLETLVSTFAAYASAKTGTLIDISEFGKDSS